ncbi:MAG: Rrf2 family transcriptional regulator [Treponema sp.]|jgi:Rrf2 family protein|nr:Rrf2 family transcriptional regulator [Treponema sp.]
MRISTKGRYSLEALLYLALLEPGDYASTRTIALETRLSEGYLEQLFIPLRKAHLVHGIRGPQGGYTLEKSPAEVKVSDILRAVEGPLSPVDCVDSVVCPFKDECRSRYTWAELYETIVSYTESVSLQNLADAYRAMDMIEYTI